MTRTTRLPPSNCPACGALLDSAGDLFGNDRPKPGDLAVCIECNAVNLYDDKLRLRAATAAELAKIEPETAGNLKTLGAAVRATLPTKH